MWLEGHRGRPDQRRRVELEWLLQLVHPHLRAQANRQTHLPVVQHQLLVQIHKELAIDGLRTMLIGMLWVCDDPHRLAAHDLLLVQVSTSHGQHVVRDQVHSWPRPCTEGIEPIRDQRLAVMRVSDLGCDGDEDVRPCLSPIHESFEGLNCCG